MSLRRAAPLRERPRRRKRRRRSPPLPPRLQVECCACALACKLFFPLLSHYPSIISFEIQATSAASENLADNGAHGDNDEEGDDDDKEASAPGVCMCIVQLHMLCIL